MDVQTAADIHADRIDRDPFVLALEIAALRGLLSALAQDMGQLGDHVVSTTDRNDPEALARAGGSLAVLNMLTDRLNGYIVNANAVVDTAIRDAS